MYLHIYLSDLGETHPSCNMIRRCVSSFEIVYVKGLANKDPWTPDYFVNEVLLLISHAYWVYIVYGYSHATGAKLGSCNRDDGTLKA